MLHTCKANKTLTSSTYSRTVFALAVMLCAKRAIFTSVRGILLSNGFGIRDVANLLPQELKQVNQQSQHASFNVNEGVKERDRLRGSLVGQLSCTASDVIRTCR